MCVSVCVWGGGFFCTTGAKPKVKVQFSDVLFFSSFLVSTK